MNLTSKLRIWLPVVELLPLGRPHSSTGPSCDTLNTSRTQGIHRLTPFLKEPLDGHDKRCLADCQRDEPLIHRTSVSPLSQIKKAQWQLGLMQFCRYVAGYLVKCCRTYCNSEAAWKGKI